MTIATIDLESHPLTAWNGLHGLPDFNAFDETEFEPVFHAALASHRSEIDAIAGNPDSPTIANTLRALELSGEPLRRVSAVFWCLAGAHTNQAIQELERTVAPQMARHYSAIYANTDLFARVDKLYWEHETLDLDPETARVLEKTRKNFIRAGARLDNTAKSRLSEINEELAGLGAKFGQNVLADESDWIVFLQENDLDGIPGFLRKSMATAATLKGRDGAFAVTLSRSLVEPFLTFSSRRDLRKKILQAFAGRGENSGENGNYPIVSKMLALRAEKARLLGYANYAAYKLDDTMAKTPEAVNQLLDPVWKAATAKAATDRDDLARLASGEGQNDPIAPWDWRYYAEKLRREHFSFDESELKSYLVLDNVIAAAFDVANRLFGISFHELASVRVWHDDVRIFEVRNPDGTRRGLFLADYFARPSKRSGAWMSSFQSGYRLGNGSSPVIYNVMNFAKPAAGEPALLSLDEARTLFHEFGHALHGLLSDVTWPSVSGTSVARDFVELPSQLFEHWLTVPEILKRYALHFETGEPMPQALLDKVKAAETFNSGFATVEFTSSALVDMAFHEAGTLPADPARFESETLANLDMPDGIIMRHRTPHFLHIFAGDGYSAGYYSYMWSEVLDADAFAAFEETGDPFDPELAQKLKQQIYAAGGSADPEQLYTAFRGKMPTPGAMMKKRGLA